MSSKGLLVSARRRKRAKKGERTERLPRPDHDGAVETSRSEVGVVGTPGDSSDVCGLSVSCCKRDEHTRSNAPESWPTSRLTAFQFSTLVSVDPQTLPPRPLQGKNAVGEHPTRLKRKRSGRRTAPSSKS